MSGAPLEPRIADTLAATVVVVGTIGGDDRAQVSGSAPGSSSFESQTSSAVIALNAAVRNSNAALA